MILLTGFEPFGGDAVNPSIGAARLAGQLLRGEGQEVEVIELPCIFGSAGEQLREAIRRSQPELVLCTGLAGGRAGLSLERVAINVDDARIPDNAGAQPIDEEVVAGGPAAFFSTLPIKAALQALSEAGIQASISQSAGTYVCNHVFYVLMHELSGYSGSRGGFVHVPYETAQPARASLRPSMELGRMAEGLAVVARTALTVPGELQLAAGAGH
jgi:pyroglutamyl-peptidase